MAASGFLLASSHFSHFALGQLAAVLAGMSLVIASACVFNNYIDRGLDKKMARTSKRALVTRAVSGPTALTYAALLAITGFGILTIFTNSRVVLLNLAAFFSYVVVYGWAKRKTVHGTLVGTIPGAIPPAAGYAAVSGKLDGGVLILFLIMVFWQMPHFYSIAIYRFKDYKAASLPVMPVRYGMRMTKNQVLAYIWLFAAAAAALSIFNYTGYIYLAAMLGLSIYWFWLGFERLKLSSDEVWGRKMFRFSLIVLLSLSILIPLGSVLP
jgi:protoheme IX farnesyltransferase